MARLEMFDPHNHDSITKFINEPDLTTTEKKHREVLVEKGKIIANIPVTKAKRQNRRPLPMLPKPEANS